MALFNRRQKPTPESSVTLPRVQSYQQNVGGEAPRSLGARIVSAAILFVLAGAVLVGLFFGGRFLYSALQNDENATTPAIDEGQESGGSQTTTSDEPQNVTPQTQGTATNTGNAQNTQNNELEGGEEAAASGTGQRLADVGPDNTGYVLAAIALGASSHYVISLGKRKSSLRKP